MTHRVVIIGGGFGGLFATKRLKRAPVAITVIDRTPNHLFQPLLYQVATGVLSQGEVAPSLRDVLRRQRNVDVVLGDVVDIDPDARTVTSTALDSELVHPYDTLIVTAGSGQSYFGHDEFAEHAPGLKSIDDALEVRSRIFGAFEMAEREADEERRRAWMTFVIVGGGPTGVEMAGQIAELSRHTLSGSFRRINPRETRIVLVDGGARILRSFDESLSDRASEQLRAMGVELRLGTQVTDVDAHGIEATAKDGSTYRIDAAVKVWAAGVEASPLGALLARRTGAQLTPRGQLCVQPDCTLPGHAEVFIVGDLMALDALPGVAEVAIQSGRHAASEIVRRLEGDTAPRPFHYIDLGNLAAISRFYAVAERGRVRVSGFPAWLVWLVVHLTFLTGFKSRVGALFEWIISFFGRAGAERTFTLPEADGRDRAVIGDHMG